MSDNKALLDAAKKVRMAQAVLDESADQIAAQNDELNLMRKEHEKHRARLVAATDDLNRAAGLRANTNY